MRDVRSFFALMMVMMVGAPVSVFASSHREAPITALDHPADITDYYAFVSYDDPTKVTFLMNVDPFLEPSNGPNYFPFDPSLVYSIKIDNTYDAVEDVSFEFRFTTAIRAPGVFTGFVGAGAGLNAPANAPLNSVGMAVIPPAITTLDGAGAAGLSLQQTYTVTMVKGTGDSAVRTDLTAGNKLIAVPSNVGPRTMPNYPALAKQGIFSLANGVRVFAGTVDDPFYIDLGAAFDSLNLRGSAFFGGNVNALGIALPVLLKTQDLNDGQNFAPDAVAGFNVNTIAIEVPISMVTQAGKPVLGTWATTSRAKMTIRPADPNATAPGPNDFTQIQRMGNPLINELIIGTGSKDKWSMSAPKDDAQFASFALDPLLARALNAVFGITVPDPPRLDLLPLVEYVAPVAPAGTPTGPIADLIRLNTSIAPAAMSSRSRLGFLGDGVGYPNGRRVSDDVVDISLRAVAGILCSPTTGTACMSNGFPFSAATVPALGDGVNANDVPYQETFPYVAWAHSGYDFDHVGKTKKNCAPNCSQY